MSKAWDRKMAVWRRRRGQIIQATKTLNMRQVGAKFGISRQRVRQIVEASK